MKTRRELLLALGAGLAWPLASRAQPAVKPAPRLFRVGMLSSGARPSLREIVRQARL